MLKQSLPINSIILGAARYVAETRKALGEEGDSLVLASYDTLRAIGVPQNGLVMVFGQQLLDNLGEPAQPFDQWKNRVKCALCEGQAVHMVKTKGQTILAVCPDCGAQLASIGAQELL